MAQNLPPLYNDDPLQFTIGEGQVISGLEQVVMGMRPGEAKTAQILADQAYCPYQEDKVVQVNRDRFPAQHLELQIGTVLRMRKAGGEKIRRIVTTVSETSVTLDANHPLAGEDLTLLIVILLIDPRSVMGSIQLAWLRETAERWPSS